MSRSGPADAFRKLLEPLMVSGTTMLIPAGDGCYPDRIDKAKADGWFSTLSRAVTRGVTVYLFVTAPNARTNEIWEPIRAKHPSRFFLVTIDRTKMKPELATEVKRLDTFHPVLLFQGSLKDAHIQPLAMWIEHYHPLGEAEAHGIEVVGRKSARLDERFGAYRELLMSLLLSPGTCVNGQPADMQSTAQAA